MTKILFFAEDVTLAHVGRMIELAGALDPDRFEVAVACGKRYRDFVEQAGLRVVDAYSMPATDFARCLANGQALYTRKRLQTYLADDLAIIARDSPDILVGDFRLSLGISAELTKLPYFAVINGQWSPYSKLKFPTPELPVVKALGPALGGFLLHLFKPLVFKQHAAAINSLRKSLGLKELGSLYQVYTHGTWTLYPDIPELAPTAALPANHAHIGPLVWEPPMDLPADWQKQRSEQPLVYLNLGSSGDERIFDAVVQALAPMPVEVWTASAGRKISTSLPANVRVAPYLPGNKCASLSSLLICNGGSGSIYQALEHGVPVLGIASNADQYLCMAATASRGAGCLIRAGQVNPKNVRRTVGQLLQDPGYRQQAQTLRKSMAQHNAKQAFADRIDSWMQTQKETLMLCA